MSDKRLQARRKLLGLLHRSKLEELSSRQRPHLSSRPGLTDDLILRWDQVEEDVQEEVQEALDNLWRKAK